VPSLRQPLLPLSTLHASRRSQPSLDEADRSWIPPVHGASSEIVDSERDARDDGSVPERDVATARVNGRTRRGTSRRRACTIRRWRL